MTLKLFRAGIAAGLVLAAVPCLAQTPDRGALPQAHDSNTLHKLGNAIQYPARKLGENTSKTTQKTAKATQYVTRKGGEHTSVAVHQATNHNSVITRRNKQAHRVVTPGGHVYTIHQAKAQGLAQ